MLWYKAWLETRSRFLIALVGIVVLCWKFAGSFVHMGGSNQSMEVQFRMLSGVNILLVQVWLLAITALMMGGLLREKALGSSSFTLSLPVSRRRLMLVRAGMGLAEAAMLAVVPWIAMLFAAHVAGKTHSITQACFHVFLLLSGGVVFFAIAFLASSLVSGEYTAPVVGFGVIVMLIYAMRGEALRPYDPWYFMLGFSYLQRHSFLAGPIPWLPAACFVSVAAFLVIISIAVIERRDF